MGHVFFHHPPAGAAADSTEIRTAVPVCSGGARLSGAPVGDNEASYRALLAVTNVLNSQRDTDSLWRAITEQIRKVLSWERAGITLYHPETDSFRFHAVETNMPNRVLQRDAVIPKAGSAVGWVYEHRAIHVRPDLHRERVFLEDQYYAQEGLGRMINLPLLVGDACIGTLNIGSVERGEPDPGHLEFLQLVATQIAYAVDHVKSYEQIDKLRHQLARENAYLVEELKLTHNFGAMVGLSAAFRKGMAQAEAVAPTSTTVLITGETGTGKELMARAIHELSPRRDKPFIRVNCAALPMGLVESELFGHERGAFTGADQRRPGRFELANGGTLFLDEIGEMPLEAQAKLLRVLEDGLVDRVGGTRPVPVDVRVIAATNSDLVAAVSDGQFRSDLYYRLHVFPILLPPLRDRREDIPLLARHFLEAYRVKLKRPALELSADSMDRLTRYAWPGNVRELQNVIERAVILARSPVVDIEPQFLSTPASPAEPSSNLTDIERRHIVRVLESTHWRIYGPQGAAAQLGMNPSTLRSRMKKLGVTRPANLPIA
ncbi:sigma-54-dependent Fis family transcriptional regulator [Nitrospira moscoviensis]|uniref:sigma-54-dependent Fis family transcriptional regulator n=1 Tax=Nitrospira moscoviensis TaxID=42253 RepID=UPI0009FAC133|nr:sigma 54-interacting transcriptional regulator [Nitrospira moscoviensis]